MKFVQSEILACRHIWVHECQRH